MKSRACSKLVVVTVLVGGLYVCCNILDSVGQKSGFFFFNQLSEVVDENLKEKVNTLENILTMQRLFS